VADFAAEMEDVTVVYPSLDGPVSALRGVTVGFAQGSSTAFVGRSGSGKSTLVSVLSLMRKATSGDVRVDGVSVSSLSDSSAAALRSTRIGIVFQSYHLEPALTAVENVMLSWFFSSHAMSGGVARGHAASILDRLGVADLAERKPHEMSGGQRQRVAIGRALFPEPALFVADEPTGNLDEETANDVAQTIFSLPGVFGTTVVVVTHDAAVAAMAGRCVELVRGEIVDL